METSNQPWHKINLIVLSRPVSYKMLIFYLYPVKKL
jgi:hypothetical protein